MHRLATGLQTRHHVHRDLIEWSHQQFRQHAGNIASHRQQADRAFAADHAEQEARNGIINIAEQIGQYGIAIERKQFSKGVPAHGKSGSPLRGIDDARCRDHRANRHTEDKRPHADAENCQHTCRAG